MTEETAAAGAKKVRETVKVKMGDGREVEFGLKEKVKKDVLVDGRAGTRFDYSNGEVRIWIVPQHHLLYSAGHGLGQKIGDSTANMKNEDGTPPDVDDIVLAHDELYERLSQDGSDWNQARGSGVGGTSFLIKALMEAKGKDLDSVKKFLSTKTDDEKKALKLLPAIKSIITRLQDERDAKKTQNIDANALFAELETA